MRPAGAKPPSARRSGGFTLIEILVATLAFAVLLAALNSVLFSALHLRREAVQRIDDLDERRQVRQLIEKDLRNAILSGGLLASNVVGTTHTEGRGRADRLEFYSTTGRVGDQEPWSEIQRVSYYVDDQANDLFTTNTTGRTLVRDIHRNLLSQEQQEEDVSSTPLLRDVESFELSYYDGTAWSDSWDSSLMDNAPPTAVRVYLSFVDDPWREWRIPPMEILVPWTTVPHLSTTEEEDTEAGEDGDDSNQPPGGGGSSGGGGGNEPPGGGGGRG